MTCRSIHARVTVTFVDVCQENVCWLNRVCFHSIVCVGVTSSVVAAVCTIPLLYILTTLVFINCQSWLMIYILHLYAIASALGFRFYSQF